MSCCRVTVGYGGTREPAKHLGIEAAAVEAAAVRSVIHGCLVRGPLLARCCPLDPQFSNHPQVQSKHPSIVDGYCFVLESNDAQLLTMMKFLVAGANMANCSAPAPADNAFSTILSQFPIVGCPCCVCVVVLVCLYYCDEIVVVQDGHSNPQFSVIVAVVVIMFVIDD